MPIGIPERREVGLIGVKINFVLTRLRYLSNYTLLPTLYKTTNVLFIILITIFFLKFIPYTYSVYFILLISRVSSNSTVYCIYIYIYIYI